MNATFFQTAPDWRAWLEAHHATAKELLVGYFKKDSGQPSITWPESVDEALCFGWIDGIRKRLDDSSYTIRFTPRKPNSVWSAVNIRRVAALTAEGRMQPAGLAAFAIRRENRSGIYSYEQRRDELPEPYRGTLRQNARAAAFFDAQPSSYKKAAGWWVVSAKKEETRLKRLQQLITHSARGERISQFMRKKPSQ